MLGEPASPWPLPCNHSLLSWGRGARSESLHASEQGELGQAGGGGASKAGNRAAEAETRRLGRDGEAELGG